MDTLPTRYRLANARAPLARRVSPLGALALVAVIILGACTGDRPSPPADATAVAPGPALAAETATPARRSAPTATPWVAPRPTRVVRPSPTPTPSQFTVHLINIATGEVDRLYDSTDRQPFPVPEFTPDGRGVWVHDIRERRTALFTLDGMPEATLGWGDLGAPSAHRCTPTDEDGIVRIDGRLVEANCGQFSPDGSVMAYQRRTDEMFELFPGVNVRLSQEWLLDVETGERTLVQDGLVPCGGCDGFAAPAWSPSGRYYLFLETRSSDDQSRVFVTDTTAGSTRVVASGHDTRGRPVNGRGDEPVWSPVSDTLLLPGPDGGTIVEHFPSGEVLELPDVGWPSAFSDDGRYIVSPRVWQAPTNDTGPGQSETVVVDSASGRTVARLEGARSPSLIWIDFRVMVAFGDEPAALVEGSVACSRGTTALHHPLAPGGAICLDGVSGATLSPHGDRVAFTSVDRRAGTVRQVTVLDVASGEEQTFVLPSFVSRGAFTLIRWNDAGTHLLVIWPVGFGI